MSSWPSDAMMLGARGSPSSFARAAACGVRRVASCRPAPAPPPVGTRLGTVPHLGDRREGELAGTGRLERRSRAYGSRPGESDKGLGLRRRETT
jgi:hypothetical protein